MVSPDGSHVYVANYNGHTVSVIDTADNTVSASIPVGSSGAYPNDVAVTPDGTRAYVTLEGSADVAVIDTATNAVVTTISAITTYGLAITPNGQKLFVANIDGGTVSTSALDLFPAIATTSLPTAELGSPYSTALEVTGSPIPVIAHTGDLPPGLTLSSAGILSGTPTTPGSYTFTVTATNATSGIDPAVASRTYTLVIAAPASDAELILAPGFGVGDLAPNAPITLSGSGLQANSAWSAVMRSTPVTLALGVTDEQGDFSLGANLPANVEAGTHTITLFGISPDGDQWTRVLYITVDASSRVTYLSTDSAEEVLAAAGVLAATGVSATAGLSAGTVLATVGFILLGLGMRRRRLAPR
jgi:YVTN family beta-propeller protein